MNPYKEYYLATEESFTLSNTVGVSYEEWQISNKRINDAADACESAEANNDVTITFSDKLAHEVLEGQGEVELLNLIRIELANRESGDEHNG